MLPADERFRSDPAFHALVMTMYHMLREYKFSATEMREAAMLACQIHDSRTIRPLIGAPFDGKGE